MKNLFPNTLLGFTPYWNYKRTNAIHADSPGGYTSEKTLNVSIKINLKCNVIDGSVVKGSRQPILYSLLLDKPGGYKFFSQPQKIHFKKVNKYVLNTISFYLEYYNHKPVDLNGDNVDFYTAKDQNLK